MDIPTDTSPLPTLPSVQDDPVDMVDWLLQNLLEIVYMDKPLGLRTLRDGERTEEVQSAGHGCRKARDVRSRRLRIS